ncbi:NlpC/P60 family protein [Streptantibioticus ferralitis]|uniref:Bifunctional lytic transglycosylase/C40 family peptidase n=1 Tax=Streptantibioticus ferralitis TaxID=236510 RepID=A0ABT5Z7H5_9ACTN|nr:bifunctional lytic transglycosylase/C40 family peptidase [Streptantibioticus ferralitis]MDF2259678.1 bifunctional lytic transglycosylase/C40 family peptidase [Streptantibioticus ferralitis]
MSRKTLLGLMCSGLVMVAFAITATVAAIASVSSGQQDNSTSAMNTSQMLTPGAVPPAYAGLVQQWGHRCAALTPAILAAQLQQESGWNPTARSDAGAEGIAQFLPSTWATYGMDANGDGVANIWDPADAIPSAAVYDCTLAQQVARVPGDPTANMLAAYNAGPGAVLAAQGVPPFPQTQDYVHSIEQTAAHFAAAPVAGSAAAQTAIAAALSQQGVPYSWGGGGPSGPTTGSCCSPGGHSGEGIRGFDCSGLTQYAYAQAGIMLPRTAAEQAAVGQRIPASAGIGALQPGDLVFFATLPGSDGTIFHVGIYLGNGQMINAARPDTPVKIDPITAMGSSFAGGARLV